MIFKSDGGRQSDLNGFLDSGSHIEGELRFETSFRIDGSFRGNVVSNGELIVGEGGEVEGEVRAGLVVVSGTLRGRIRASGKVQISSRGKVFADIDTPTLVVEDGAFFEGHCAMAREGARAAVPKLVPQNRKAG